MVSSMLTAVVTVIGVSAVVHITMRFREARWAGLPPRDALSRAGTLVAGPIFWSIATDVVGFLSLMLARVGPIQDFGLMMALGATMVLVAIVLLVPGLVLAGRFDGSAAGLGGRPHRIVLDRLSGWFARRPVTVAVLTLTVAGVCLAGTARLKVETDFTRNFRADSPIVRSYAYIESHLGGAGVWDVVLPAPQTLDWDFLRGCALWNAAARGGRDSRRGRRTRPGADQGVQPGGGGRGRRRWIWSRCHPAVRNVLLAVGLAELRRQVPGLVPSLYGEDPSEPESSTCGSRCGPRAAARSRETGDDPAGRTDRPCEFPPVEIRAAAR